MANGPFLLELNYNFNPLLQQTFCLPQLRSFPINLSCGDNNVFKLNKSPSPKLRTKCFVMSHKSKVKNGIGGNGVWENHDLEPVAISNGINEVLWISIKNVLKTLQKPVITGGLLGLLLLYDNHHGCVALAATTTLEGAVGVAPPVRFLPAAGYGLYCMMLLAFGVGYMTHSVSGNDRFCDQIGDNKCSQASATTLSLLRHPEYCISGYSSADMEWDILKAGNLFNQLSVIERGKSDLDTLINVNLRKTGTSTRKVTDFSSEYSVITIIVAARGIRKLPPINSSANLKEALHILATIPSYSLEGVAVLLTPRIENDNLVEQKFLENYSLLHPL